MTGTDRGSRDQTRARHKP